MSWLARLATQARVPVFALVGDGGRPAERRLLGDARLRLVESPRHAAVLLVLGDLPEALHESARRVHDQLPVPRATVVLAAGGLAAGAEGQGPFARAVLVREAAEVADVVVHTYRALLSAERPSEGCLGPEQNPVQWQGKGPHGQGGEGMMGGKPYGRALAMTGADLRDGLELDQVELPLGPFLRWLPPGLRIDLVLQGDVVQRARLEVAPFVQRDQPEIFRRAFGAEVAVAQLELERARHHLFATADLLRLHGLEAQADRITRWAPRLRVEDEGALRKLARWLRWTGALRWATRGVGVLKRGDVQGFMGPLARAAGLEQDARSDDPGYKGLGFEPITQQAGDCEARFEQRLAEAAQALSLARRAGSRRRTPGPALEGPRGASDESSGAQLRDLLPRLAVGQAFDALSTTIVSLDLDASVLGQRSSDGAAQPGTGAPG